MKQFQDTDGTMLIELRSNGQTVVPPSVHPSGEELTFHKDGFPSKVNPPILEAAVAKAAGCALLARNWPNEGSRNRVALALAGVLTRAGWSQDDIEEFIRTTARIAGDEEAEDRGKQVEPTVTKYEGGYNFTGIPTVKEIMGENVVKKLVEWLKLQPERSPDNVVAVAVPRIWSSDELLQHEFPPMVWIVENLLTAGLTTIAGRPKTGKSWFALQIARSVASGTGLLGLNVDKGSVVYMAIEDNALRLKRRLHQQHWDEGLDVVFLTEIDRSEDSNGLKYIEDVVKDRKPRVLIIDTVTRLLRDVKSNELNDMTNALGSLQTLALQENCAILLIDHVRKGDTSDSVIAQVIGSTAKTAVSDSIWCLQRDNISADGLLTITGRDVEEQEIHVAFDSSRYVWRPRNVMPTEAQTQVLDSLKESSGRATPSGIAQMIKKADGMPSLYDASNVGKCLRELYEMGFIRGTEKVGRERWYILKDEEGIPDFFDDDEPSEAA
jgi:hypothetical protein